MSEPRRSPPIIEADDFARRFSLRGSSLMWFLGAGASAAAGVPTAYDMIWEFKQKLYASQRRISLETVSDLSSPIVRQRLQDHVDSSIAVPENDPTEYAALFEAAFPSEADRRTYIDAKIAGASPSFGHLALGALMHAGRLRIAWTTNFDPLIADACARVFGGTGSLTTVTPDAPEIASQLVSDGRWPLEIKLHGDFRSRRLRNTTDELRHQDAQLRADLLNLCKLSGLVVVGYSGRDDSIMDCLQNAVATGGFPSGLFWLHRGEAPPLPRVEALLEQANDQGIECGLVPIDNFDECLRDLVRLSPELDTKVLDEFTSSRRRWSPAPRPAGRAGWPVVRLNALPIVEMPTFCRRVVCGVGGYAATRAAFEAAACDVPFARARAGVLCFGEDDEIGAALSSFGIEEFDLFSIEPRRLRYESAECGLLRDVLARAVARTHRMNAYRQRNTTLLAPSNPADDAWSGLRPIVGELQGTVARSSDLQWSEGVSLRLAWADHRPWLLFEPRTVFRGISDLNRAAAADFSRERTVKRYNRQLNDLFAFWAEKLAGNGEEIIALGVRHGVDAAFRLSGETAFSKRAR